MRWKWHVSELAPRSCRSKKVCKIRVVPCDWWTACFCLLRFIDSHGVIMAAVKPELVSIALDKCDPGAFEKYAQSVFSQVVGPAFKPLGGMHDGGADGFIENDFEQVGHPSRFFQASKQANVSAKIRHTVKRLQEAGREVKRLYFASSLTIPNSDRLAHEIGEEFDVSISIYDRTFFEQHANDSTPVQLAFDHYLRASTAFLDELKAPSFPSNSPIPNAQAVCAFLGQELERRLGTVKTLEAVCDSLILWTLEGTDPDKSIFLTKDQIAETVIAIIPSAKRFFREHLTDRLAALQKKVSGQRQINHHRKDGYCLPFETRQTIREATVSDEKLKADVTASFTTRLAHRGGDQLDPKTLTAMPWLLHKTLEGVFERQGADAARHFLDAEKQGEALNNKAIVQLAEELLHASSIKPDQQQVALDQMRHVLRDIFYAPTPVERTYCSRLSRTYMLLFTLRNTPDVIDYFNAMAGKFELSVGCDIILHAISEYYLPAEAQMAANALKIIAQAESTLYITESTLEELHSHIYASDREYHSSYADIEAHVDYALASQSDRILIRAYYYSKLEVDNPKRPRSWKQFLGNFFTYDAMTGSTSAVSMKTLRDTLANRFRLRFLSHEEMRKGIPRQDIEKLTDKLYDLRHGCREQDRVKAENDALQILRVHQARELEDKIGGNPFGYRNWWLTQETLSSAAAAAVFPRRRDSRYVMRPQFLVNYIAYNPTTAEVRESLRTIFPSNNGIRLANRIDEKTLGKVLKHLRDANATDPARAQAMVAEYGDALKSATVREFVLKYDKSVRRSPPSHR